ncbi:50S ribosomal protein L25 [Candidatus Microgenomates bacterium]|nr:50S ribosomal protein L25 [Candidatus Microgenomates bacterium]
MASTDRVKLAAKKRTLEGRKVRALRRDGIMPANVYGKKITSQALELPLKEFQAVYEKAGETGLIDLQVDEETKPVLIVNVQLHPVTDLPIHADFRQVDLTEKITATVPVELTGEAPAEKSGIGILVQQTNEVEVEALPTDLPEKLLVDVSKLENVDEAIYVSDLMVAKDKVTVVTEGEQIVAKIEPPAKEEEVAPPAPAEGEAVEGEVPAEGGETPATEEKPTIEEEKKKA